MNEITSTTRHGFTIDDGDLIPYGRLRRYVCADCGGRLVHGFNTCGDWVRCGQCKSTRAITAAKYEKEVIDGWDVWHQLPKHIRAMYAEPEEPAVTGREAIEQLFD